MREHMPKINNDWSEASVRGNEYDILEVHDDIGYEFSGHLVIVLDQVDPVLYGFDFIM